MSNLMPWARPTVEQQVPKDIDWSRTKVAISTPSRGRSVGDNYMRSVDDLRSGALNKAVVALRDGVQGSGFLEAVEPVIVEPRISGPHDLTRTRSRHMRMFLENTSADWMLLWDDDVWTADVATTLSAMLTTALIGDIHILGAMYPGKYYDEQRIIAAVQRGEEHPLQHGVCLQDMRYWRDPEMPDNSEHDWLVEVCGVGFGFCLVSRIALIAMTERYRQELQFQDSILGGSTVGLAYEILKDGKSMSEDYSFCSRARAIGLKVYAFMGPGTPMNHDGMHTFHASPDVYKDKEPRHQ
jgi:hypothetical protein